MGEATGKAVHSDELLPVDGRRPRVDYASLHGSGDVQRIKLRSGQLGWLITGYHTARQALVDPRLHARTAAVGDSRRLSPATKGAINTHMLNLEPPDQARLRSLVAGAFTRRRINELRPQIQRITDNLLDAMADQDQVDLIDALALPLPIRVLSGLLGVPERDADALHGWTATLTTSALPLEQLEAAAAEMLTYVRQLLDHKRREPADDILTTLVNAHDRDRQLSQDELTSMVFLLLTAGHETTVNLIGNAVYTLLTAPGQLARLRTDAALLPAAIDEILRYEGPAKAVLRRNVEPVELGGVIIPAGSVIIVSLPVANRDPERFAVPDQLDVARPDNPHLGFGHGIHHCLGAPLARLEGVVAVGSLLNRFPGIRLALPAEELSWRASMFLHGLASLPVWLR